MENIEFHKTENNTFAARSRQEMPCLNCRLIEMGKRLIKESITSLSVRVMRALKPSLDHVSNSQDILVALNFNRATVFFCC